jgi:hypothetical protein
MSATGVVSQLGIGLTFGRMPCAFMFASGVICESVAAGSPSLVYASPRIECLYGRMPLLYAAAPPEHRCIRHQALLVGLDDRLVARRTLNRRRAVAG